VGFRQAELRPQAVKVPTIIRFPTISLGGKVVNQYIEEV